MQECPQPQHGYSPRASSPPSYQQKVMIHPSSLRVGRANFTMVEEIPPGEEVLTGTFFLFEHPIVILFDSRASHDIMSLACTQKAKLTLWANSTLYSITTPGRHVVANCMVCVVPLELVGRVFPTSLMILEGQGIDVILGMNWMKRHKAIFDISAGLIHLDSPIFGKVSLQLPPIASLHASIYTVITKSMDVIPMVHEYRDVFPDDLSGMPPDRAIEFKIEL
jgi:hypothetical protein